MFRITIADLRPAGARLTGAVCGESHAQQICKRVAQLDANEADIAILDFTGIASASASYLKRLIGLFYVAPGGPEGLKFPVSPVATNVESSDLREDLEDYLAGNGRVLTLADAHKSQLKYRGLLGRLDGAAAETFNELRTLKTSTAAQLYERHPERTTNQTAWNNRLAQLVEMRVARRSREGRLWIYEPTVKN